MNHFQLIVTTRIAEHQQKEAARIEAETARIRAEAEQQARAAAEQAARAQAQAEAKVRSEAEAAAAKLVADAAMARAAAPAPAPVEPTPTPSPAPVPAAFAAVRQAFPAPAETADAEPTLSLGEISARTGLPLSAALLRGLGFSPAGQRRAAILCPESDFESMLLAIEAHLRNVRQAHRANA